MRLRVQEVRMARGLSCRALARMAGVSRSYLQQIEAGECMPTITILCRIALALRAPLDDLVDYK